MKNQIKRVSGALPAVLSALLLLYIAVRYLMGICLPFLLAVISAYAVRKLMRGRGHRIIRVILCMLIPILFAAVPAALMLRLPSLFNALSQYIADGISSVYSLTRVLIEKISDFAGGFLPDIGREDVVTRVTSALTGALTSLAYKTLPSAAGKIISGIPSYLMFCLTFTLSLFACSAYYEEYTAFARHILGNRFKSAADFCKGALHSVLSYIKASLTVCLIVFAELFFGLTVAGVKKPLLLAALSCAADALPVLGSGAVLVPCAVYRLLAGKTGEGIFMLVLSAVTGITRRIAEPKIIGSVTGIGFFPSVMLTYAGYMLFGFYGMIILPAAASFVYAVYKKNEK